MAEGSTPGASGLLFGGRGAQAAADALQRTLTRLDQSVSRATPVFDTIGKMGTAFRQGQGGGSWNRGSNWVGSNGGGATFSNQQAGTHRADVPTQYTGGNGSGGGRRTAPGPGFVTAGAVAGAAYGLATRGDGQAPQPGDIGSNFRGQNYVVEQFRHGAKRSMPYKDIFTQGMQNTAQSGADLTQAGAIMSRTTGGNPLNNRAAWEQGMAWAGGATVANPTVSSAQAGQIQQPMYTATGWNQMRRVGIRTYDKGKRQSPTQIAQQILSKVGLGTKKLSGDEISYVLDDPLSNTNKTLDNWVANGLITPDQRQLAIDQMRMILTARIKGADSERLHTLLEQRAKGGDVGAKAEKEIQSLGIDTSQISKDLKLAGAKRWGESGSFEGFEWGLSKSTEALTDFYNVLNTILNATGINTLKGGWKGLGEWGAVGKGLGLFSGVGKAAMSPITAATSLFGGGGADTSGVGNGSGGDGASATGTISGGFSEAAAIMGVVGGGGVGVGSSPSASTGSSDSSTTTDPATTGGGGTGGTSGAPALPPGDYSSMFGGVKPWVARAGVEIRDKFGVRDIGGVGGRSNNPTSDHPKGLALDFMVYDNKSKGDRIAAYVVTNRRRLGVTYVIWYKRIFGSSGTWKSYGHPSGGTSPTLLHMDHVHVSFVTKDPGHGGASSSGGGGNTAGASSAAWTPDGARAVGKAMAKRYGWGSSSEWSALNALWTKESGWRVEADNPTSSAYGIPQALIALHNMPMGYYSGKKGSGSNTNAWGGIADVQIKWGLDYIKNRYGSPSKAWAFHKSHNWYDKGAWEIKQDEDARVHKGEMVIPHGEADQIREILMNGNAYGATARGSRRGSGGGVVINFKPGSIVVHAGAGATAGQGRALGKGIVDAIAQDSRIKALQNGAYTHG